MEEKKLNQEKKFFLAANSYNGFISYFDQVFKSEDFDRIYILKGGPGTGKSSFMRKISEILLDEECQVEEIYCSSDPHSLDGIIAEKNDRRIAIIDGTAPHERDAVIPGAIDEIINLADSWDNRWLTNNRDKILSLANEKSKAYKTAYSYLKIAGVSSSFITTTYQYYFNKNKAKFKAEEILSDVSGCNNHVITTRLVNSFGRYGEYNLDTLTKISKKVISVGGDEISSMIFMDYCAEILRQREATFMNFPLALDSCHTDSLFIPMSDIAIIRSRDGEINADEFFALCQLNNEKIKKAMEIKNEALMEAKRWFAIASELHFNLENIYGKAMDFSKNDQKISNTLTEINNILEI